MTDKAKFDWGSIVGKWERGESMSIDEAEKNFLSERGLLPGRSNLSMHPLGPDDCYDPSVDNNSEKKKHNPRSTSFLR